MPAAPPPPPHPSPTPRAPAAPPAAGGFASATGGAARAERARVLGAVEPSVDERHEAVDVARLFQAAAELNFAMLADSRRAAGAAGEDDGA